MSAHPWPSDALDMLTALWADGRSGTEISRELWDRLGLKYSRNAVIGKVHRLRLPKRKTVLTPKGQARKGAKAVKAASWDVYKERQRATARHAARVRKPPARLTKPAPTRPRRSIPMEAPTPMNLTIMQLTSRTRKWPVNDPPKGEPFLFCGVAKEAGAKPYCPFHARLASGPGTESERRAYRPYREMARASA